MIQVIEMPRYMRPKDLASGETGYFWELPTWARPKKDKKSGKRLPVLRNGVACPVGSEALGTEIGAAITKANALNEAFDEWKQGRMGEAQKGTVRALFNWYKGQDRYLRLGHDTRKDYATNMELVCNVSMKDGGLLGNRKATSIDGAVADALYKKLQVSGVAQATYCMRVCSVVWTQAHRYKRVTGIVDQTNPFRKMGLITKAKVGNRETSRAEYDLYRETARKLGYQSMATAAALAFELAPRVWDVFGYEDPDGVKARGIRWIGYRKGASLTYTQSKTGRTLTIPLVDFDAEGNAIQLYPDLEAELALTPQSDGLIVLEERNGQPYKKRRMSDVHREICVAAGLPKDMKFTGFRHGAATEMGDAGETDVRPVTGHTVLKTTAIYNKASQEKARRIGVARRQHVSKMSERPSEQVSEREASE